MTFWEAVSFIVALVGLIVAIAGLIAALWQLNRTNTAVEAAAEAGKRAERDSALRHLIWAVPTMGRMEDALDLAVAADDQVAVRRELTAWRIQASDLSGLLSNRDDVPPKLRRSLSSSVALAATAKNALVDPKRPIQDVTENVRAEISQTNHGLSEMSGKLKIAPNSGDKE